MAPTDAQRQRIVAAVLAVVGPLLVFAAAALALTTYADADERQARENAGRVLNARVAEHADAATVMDRMLRQSQPQVLLIGPSYANTDVDPRLLAQRLRLPRDEVLMLSVPNSVGAHWYAVLKNRVFANGHRPRLVVVVSGLQSMLLATPLTEASYLNLAVHLEGPDPVIDAKMRRSTRLALARLREKRGMLREAAFGFARDVPASFLFRSPRDPSIPIQPAEIRTALDRVFDDDKVDMSLHARGTPVIDILTQERVYDPADLPTPERSFIPDITEIVRDHGARMVFVRPPMSPDIPDHMDDVVLPGVQEETVAVVHARGGSFVDMRGLPMSSDMFKDPDHMNVEGSRRFTEALARVLLGLDALEPDRAPDTLAPFEAASVEVIGDAGPLPALEADAAGPGRWLGPGTTLRVTFDQGWDALRGPFLAHLAAEQLRGEVGPTLRIDGVEVAVGRMEAAPPWTLWQGRKVLRAPDGPFVLEVTVPDDAGWTRITGLALGEGAGRVVLEGDSTGLDGARADLFGVFRQHEGVLIDETVHPTYLRPPGAVPKAERPVEDGPGKIGRYETSRWEFLSDERLIGETNFGSRCSPLRITDEGAELPLANVPCVEVQRKGQGRSCHTPEYIYFTTVDGTDPFTNGRRYKLVLDEGRRCDGAVWLYPKDHFEVAWPADRLAVFRRGADTLTFGARYLQKRPAKVEITLRVDGAEQLRTQVDGLDLKGGPLVVPLEPPIPPGTTDVVLEVRNLEHTFYLVTEAALSEGVAGRGPTGLPAVSAPAGR